ncbi:MAG: nucleotidyltransferase family protein [Deltaproteobacteria bacterium]
MDKINAIILAGGLGSRLRSIVTDVPKVLAPVNGRPFLDIVIGSLAKSGIVDRVVLAAGYMAEKIIEQYQNSHRFCVEISVSIEEQLLGTGGAIRLAMELTDSQDILVLNGDSFIDVDYIALYRAHKQNNAQLTMVLKHVEDASRYGSVIINGDKIVLFQEKSNEIVAGFINAGVYLLNRDLFVHVAQNKIISMEKELLPDMIKHDAYGFISNGRFIDIGLPDTYKIVEDYLKEV